MPIHGARKAPLRRVDPPASLRSLAGPRLRPRHGQAHSIGTYTTKEDANAALRAEVNARTGGDGSGATAPGSRERRKFATASTSIPGPGRGPANDTRDCSTHHIVQQIGDVRVGDLTTATVRRWHATLHREASPSTAAKPYRLLWAALNTAVEDNVITVNPCSIKGAGVERSAEHTIATVTEVAALADAVPHQFRTMVLLGAWCSLRLGELAALTRADVDLLRGNIAISKTRLRLNDGSSVAVPPRRLRIGAGGPLDRLVAAHAAAVARSRPHRATPRGRRWHRRHGPGPPPDR